MWSGPGGPWHRRCVRADHPWRRFRLAHRPRTVSIGCSGPCTTVRCYLQEAFTFLPLTAKALAPPQSAADLTTAVHPCRLFNAPGGS